MRQQQVSSADAIHPFSSGFVHPYYVAPGQVCERPKAWSSAGRRGPRFGVGADNIHLGCAAARDAACVWAPWGVLGEGKARGDLRRGGRVGAIGLYIYI